MLIPAAMKQLHEPDPALDEAAGEQAVMGKAAGALDLGAVGIERFCVFARQVGQFGHARLHPEG
ncbi:hypothetical protein D3C83_257030 [compost metagenome]